MTTFTRKGDSADAQFAAEPGTNDDLIMCCVLFAWCVQSEYWRELTNTNPSESIYREKVKEEEDNQSMPLGFISISKMREIERDASGDLWVTVNDEDDWGSHWSYRTSSSW